MKPTLPTSANSVIRARIDCCECAKLHYLQNRQLPPRLQLPDFGANVQVRRSLRKNHQTGSYRAPEQIATRSSRCAIELANWHPTGRCRSNHRAKHRHRSRSASIGGRLGKDGLNSCPLRGCGGIAGGRRSEPTWHRSLLQVRDPARAGTWDEIWGSGAARSSPWSSSSPLSGLLRTGQIRRRDLRLVPWWPPARRPNPARLRSPSVLLIPAPTSTAPIASSCSPNASR